MEGLMMGMQMCAFDSDASARRSDGLVVVVADDVSVCVGGLCVCVCDISHSSGHQEKWSKWDRREGEIHSGFAVCDWTLLELML
jgi:hypothetical protein